MIKYKYPQIQGNRFFRTHSNWSKRNASKTSKE